jgi:putative endopeptidase
MKKFAAALAGLAVGVAVAAAPAPHKPAFGTWGVDLAGMDRSVKPGDDFFEYANGTWFRSTQIPPDRTSTGSFQNLQILSENRMRELIEGLEARDYATLSPEEKQIRDLYDAFTDVPDIEKRGLDPVKPDLARIASLQTPQDVAKLMGDRAFPSSSDGFGIAADGIAPDAKNSNAYVVTLTQSGLGMPNRDYYLKDDPALAATRDAYKKYLATMLSLAGETKDIEARAAAVYAMENDIAMAQWPAADRRNADKVYNPMTVAELASFAPGFDWIDYFKAQGIEPTRKVIARENTAFPALAKIFANTPVAVWRDYLTIHYLHSYAAYLPQKFDDADFAFYGTALAGRQQQSDRATRGVRLLDRTMGEPFGKLYVAKYFPPEAKAKVEKLVANLLKAYEADIKTLPWMSETTREKALDKLHTFTPHLGYPDTWRDYSDLAVDRNNLIATMKNASMFEWNRDVKRLDQPVDKNEWHMSPPTVNAYYNPSFNSITFPAAILQPPFFDPNADDAVNYGAIGVVIGHEISHGFDDQGAQYNGVGNLENWWTDQDLTAFQSRTKMLVEQFDAYEPLPGLKIKGDVTLGENIADLAGLAIAYKAYHLSLNGQTPPVLDGFTGDQRLFLGLAQVWQAKFREGDLRNRILSDEHSPAAFRVIGSTRNIDEWYRAFDIKPGDKYYLPPEQRVKLW